MIILDLMKRKKIKIYQIYALIHKLIHQKVIKKIFNPPIVEPAWDQKDLEKLLWL